MESKDNILNWEEWLAIRKQAGLKINPATAEVTWGWGQIMDPYGIDPDLPAEYDCVGRVHFARSPGSDVWVSFYDLPKGIVERLWERIGTGELHEPDWFGVLFDETAPSATGWQASRANRGTSHDT
jgi:hypothetical protein